jgi:hypothetical protein
MTTMIETPKVLGGGGYANGLIGGQYIEDVYLMGFFLVWIMAAFALTAISTVVLSKSSCTGSKPLPKPCKVGIWLSGSGQIMLLVPLAVFLGYFGMNMY